MHRRRVYGRFSDEPTKMMAGPNERAQILIHLLDESGAMQGCAPRDPWLLRSPGWRLADYGVTLIGLTLYPSTSITAALPSREPIG
jgi:hypothetical protein